MTSPLSEHPNQMVELSIICVNWNSEEYLRECIESIYANTHRTAFEIIVVDNASPAKTIDLLGERFPAVKIIKSEENLGFSRANNLGFLHSVGTYLLFLNPDTKLVGPAIDILVEESKKLTRVGIIGGKLVNPDLTVQTTSVQTFPTILNQVADVEVLRMKWPGCKLWNIAPLFEKPETTSKVEVIPGACMLLSRPVFEDVKGFSEDYFMYAEDIDLNRKAASKGFASYYVPQAVIIHYGGTSSRQQRTNQWATVMRYRAMQRYYEHHHSRAYAAAYRATMGCAAAVRLLGFALFLPLAYALNKTTLISSSAAKWAAILKWAISPKSYKLATASN